MNEQQTVIIIGAGVAGLMAAKELSGRYKVIILEADAITGGRIKTIKNDVFLHPVEAGAEFIHGDLPLTLSLMKEAGIRYHPIGGEMMRVTGDDWKEQEDMTIGWDEVMEKMESLQEDMTIADFLQRYFGEEKYKGVRLSVQRFAEGFDLADINKASVLSLRSEWEHEDEQQSRTEGGYGQLVDYLEQQCRQKGCIIHTSCIVKKIHWQHGMVKVVSVNGKTFQGHKVIVTVPLGVLQVADDHACAISFDPAITSYKEAARQMGYGSVIKIMLQFREPFWNKKKKNIGFVLSSQPVPTWWTQLPSTWPLLTGWLGGAQVNNWEDKSGKAILDASLQSLSSIFEIPLQEVQRLLSASYIIDWSDVPFSLGAYSYNTLQSASAARLLNTPIDDTVFFAGEAVYQGPYPGTVEAALASGVLVGERLIG